MSLMVGLGCGDSDGGGGQTADADADVAEGDDCRTLLAANQTFALPQEERARSFQTHAYFDGQALWFAYAFVPADVDAIQIRALRVQCDGSIASAPVIVSPDNSFTHTEPRIAGYGDKVMIAWSTDNGSQPSNLSTHYVVFDRLEGPANARSVHLDTQYKSASAGNTWMPELAAGPSGFAVAGLRGVNDFQSFQSYVQRVDSDGLMMGAAVDGELQDGQYQGQANLVMEASGDVILAWERNEEDESKHVVQVRVAAGKDVPETGPVRVSREKSSQVSLGGEEGLGYYLVSGRSAGGLLLKSAVDFDPDSNELKLGESKLAISPQVAASEGGGLVAWLETSAGFEAELYWQAFQNQDGSLVAIDEPRMVATDNPSIGAYRLSLVHLHDEVFMLTWTEGPVSDLHVKWRFLDLSVATGG